MIHEPTFAANVAAHEARWGFAPSAGADAGAIRLEAGPTAWPRLSIRTSDARWLRVHSDRQPLQEAERWLAESLDGQDAWNAPLISVIGAGAGYALELLAARADESTKFLVLEPEPACLHALFSRRSWSTLIAAGRLMVLTGPTFEGRADAWKMAPPRGEAPVILRHPVIGDARPDATRAAADVVRQAASGARANYDARERFAGRYLLNTLRNLPIFETSIDVRALFGREHGRMAILAAAGPSLNRNLEELRARPDMRANAVFIAVDTALTPSLAAGLHPDYVVAVDPGETNARKLTGLPMATTAMLVAEPSIAPASFEAFRGRTALFRVSNTHHPWPWLDAIGLETGTLRAWGSVLTTAYDLAVRLGCDPIVFIGADLAYTGGQPHCRHTLYEKEWAASLINGATLPIVWQYQLPDTTPTIDLRGAPTRSSDTLIAFRDWITAQVEQDPTRRVVNATGAGILFGSRIAQRDLGSIVIAPATAPPPRLDTSAPPRLGGAWMPRARTIIADRLGADAAATLDAWLTFACGRVSEPEVWQALDGALAACSPAGPAHGGRDAS